MQIGHDYAGSHLRDGCDVTDLGGRPPRSGLGEKPVTVGFMTVGLAIVASSIIVLWGLRRAAKF